MRYYKVLFNGKPLSQLDKNNLEAVRITFNFQNYQGAESPNSFFRIYNLPLEFFQNAQKFLGMRVEIYAGISTESAICQKIGYQQIFNDLIGFGYIQSVIGQPNVGKENYCEFVLGASPLNNAKDREILGATFEVKSGDSLKPILKEALQKIYSNAFVEIEGLEIVATSNEQLRFYNYSDIESRARQSKISIYKTTQGYKITDSDFEQKQIKVLKAPDFLQQPEFIGFETISISMRLRGDLQLTDTIEIDGKLFLTISQTSQLVAVVPKSYVMGRYTIRKIWHIGDSRSISPQSWATNIEAVQIKGGA